ncbi:MAG: RNA polymerase factor sigma-70 [Pseudomonadales bacterium]|nr:RNA polymerase factor sigma-70 [Pseudomonadales bacterium]
MKESVLELVNADARSLFDGRYLEGLRDQMLKFATLQLGNPDHAEDAVQEALLGALKSVKSFSGKAALKTWVFAILKNKIADHFRQRSKLGEGSKITDSLDDEQDLSALFDERGHWHQDEKPVAWGQPEETFKQDQFWVVFETCLNGLPAKQAKIFMMREFVDLTADEICELEGLTTSNLHVVLHRARLRLRECIENRWFLGESENAKL